MNMHSQAWEVTFDICKFKEDEKNEVSIPLKQVQSE